MNSQLIISALGDDRLGLVNTLSQVIQESGCNIEDSHMTALGGVFAIIIQVTGNWNTLAKLEPTLEAVGKDLGMTIITKRTEPITKRKDLMPYAADVISIDHPGIVYKLASFFSEKNINIEELETDSYSAAHTGTPMFSVHIEVGIPPELPISELRETFMDFCDELNLDAVIEPIKH